jgi:hypothetical protein
MPFWTKGAIIFTKTGSGQTWGENSTLKEREMMGCFLFLQDVDSLPEHHGGGGSGGGGCGNQN